MNLKYFRILNGCFPVFFLVVEEVFNEFSAVGGCKSYKQDFLVSVRKFDMVKFEIH